MTPHYLELVCPAGTPAAFRAAIEAGADTVYCGFRDATNARNYPGLNFDPDELAEAVDFAHARQRHVLVAINTFPGAGRADIWHQAVDNAASAGADAVILADIGVLDYASRRHPNLRLHLSVQAAASNPLSLAFYRERFGIRRAVLPRVLTVQEIASLVQEMGVEAEVFAFGSMGTMTEGRCILSSYLTGRSPSSDGVCAPAEHVAFAEEGDEMVIRLGGLTMNRFPKSESAGYPTPCKARLVARGVPSYLFDEPVGLNTIDILPQLKAAGVTALKIEGRQRSRAYVTQVVRAFRATLDALHRNEPMPPIDLSAIVEGRKETSGAYKKGWR
jgi:collagenase-like PrtC family protease